MKISFLAAVAFVFLCSASDVLAQSSDKVCEVSKKKHLSKTCQNKTVRLEGAISRRIMQHPVMTMPDVPGEKKTFQNYLDTKFGQIVLVSNDEITCADKIEVEGVLSMINLGGEPGTKNSYKNPFVQVAKFSCK